MSTCDTPIWISSSSVPRSRARTTRRSRPQATSAIETTVSAARTHTTRRRKSSRTVSWAIAITSGRPGRRAARGSAASSDPRPGSTAWTRPPPATSAATRSGIRSAASGLTASQSPSTVAGPKAAAIVRPASSRPVTRRRTPSMATTSSSGPAAIERPWSRIDDPVADPLDLGQQVRVEDDRRAPVARRADDRPDVRPAERVERRRRLVEEHELRVPEQRDAQPEPLLHALREAAHRVVGTIGQADPVERLVDDVAVGRRAAIRPSRAWSARTSRACSQGW